MRVLLLNHNCTPGGIETFMHGLADGLIARGEEVECFFYKDNGWFGTFAEKYPSYLGTDRSLEDVLRSNHFDVLHASATTFYHGIVPSLKRAGWNGKLIVTSHDWTHPGWTSANCFAYAAVNAALASQIEGYTDLHVDTVHNGVDVGRFRPPEEFTNDSPIVAWVGRGRDLNQKRIDLLASAAPELSERGFRLWIADPDGPEAQAPSVANTLERASERWGRVPMDDMPAFYRSVAASGGCVLSTSSFEGHSVALLEAQASGCPVIAPRVRGIIEGVSAEGGGELYEYGLSGIKLADLVTRALADKEQVIVRSRKAREFVLNRFTREHMTASYLEIYRREVQRVKANASRPDQRRARAQKLLELASETQADEIIRSHAALEAALTALPWLRANPGIQLDRLKYRIRMARRRSRALRKNPRESTA